MEQTKKFNETLKNLVIENLKASAEITERNRMQAIILESVEHGITDIDSFIPYFLHQIDRRGDVLLGISYGLRIVPMFRKALFVVDGKAFIAENELVYLGKNGERSSVPFVGCTRIYECSLKPIKHRTAKRLLALDIKRQIESLTKVLEETADAQRALIRTLKTSGFNLQRVHNTTIHNR